MPVSCCLLDFLWGSISAGGDLASAICEFAFMVFSTCLVLLDVLNTRVGYVMACCYCRCVMALGLIGSAAGYFSNVFELCMPTDHFSWYVLVVFRSLGKAPNLRGVISPS